MADLVQHALETAIRADEKANGAHARLDNNDEVISDLRVDLSAVKDAIGELRVQLGKLNTKVAVAATLGALVGSGAIAAALKFLG